MMAYPCGAELLHKLRGLDLETRNQAPLVIIQYGYMISPIMLIGCGPCPRGYEGDGTEEWLPPQTMV